MITRRVFLGGAAAAGAGALLGDSAGAQTQMTDDAQAPAAATPASTEPARRVLVVLQLSGGNDGLNTVVPFANDTYQKARPKLRLEQKEVLALDAETGLHPSLGALRARFDLGELAIVQAVGYPGPSRSHFRSLAIWHNADTIDSAQRSGWLGRTTDVLERRAAESANAAHLATLNLGNSIPFALQREHAPVLTFDGEGSFSLAPDRKYAQGKSAQIEAFRRLCSADVAADGPYAARVRAAASAGLASADRVLECLRAGKSSANYTKGIGGRLATIAKLIDGGLPARVYYATTNGYDTHARQKDAHASLLAQLSGGLDAFQQDLAKSGRDRDVVVLVFSEFGRRLQENGSAGTDHGTCGPVFLLGKSVRGGLVGAAPDLGTLVDQDPKHAIDFRAVYATVLERWLGLPADELVGSGHARLPLFA